MIVKSRHFVSHDPISPSNHSDSYRLKISFRGFRPKSFSFVLASVLLILSVYSIVRSFRVRSWPVAQATEFSRSVNDVSGMMNTQYSLGWRVENSMVTMKLMYRVNNTTFTTPPLPYPGISFDSDRKTCIYYNPSDPSDFSLRSDIPLASWLGLCASILLYAVSLCRFNFRKQR